MVNCILVGGYYGISWLMNSQDRQFDFSVKLSQGRDPADRERDGDDPLLVRSPERLQSWRGKNVLHLISSLQSHRPNVTLCQSWRHERQLASLPLLYPGHWS